MKQYLDFSRIVKRSEYWAILIIIWVLTFVVWGIGALFVAFGDMGLLIGALFMLISAILLIWISLSTTASRCRDAGLSPWWTLSTLVPYIGFITLIVFGCLESKEDRNFNDQTNQV